MIVGMDPARLLADVALAVIGVALAALLIPRQLRRARQFGGRPAAEVVIIAAVVALVVSLQADLLPVETSFGLMIVAVVVAFRPEDVVRFTGGPRLEWRALAEGTALQQLVAVRVDRQAAQHYPDVREHLARLAETASPATDRYIELVRATLFADPDGPGMADRLAALAVEEGRLRRAVGPRPAFEGGLVDVDEAPIRARRAPTAPTAPAPPTPPEAAEDHDPAGRPEAANEPRAEDAGANLHD